MAQVDPERNYDRVKATIATAAFHALLGYALVTGLGFDFVQPVNDSLKIFDVREPPPPPPIEKPRPAPERLEKPEGAAAPPSKPPTPVVAPPPKVVIPRPPPVRAAPKAGPASSSSVGTAKVAGTGTGAGGVGTGRGSGGEGSGTGGGGGASKAELIRGGLANRDYPRSAMRAGAEGIVSVRYAVETNGRVSGCSVIDSSGNASLDATTCRLIERRFQYRPARDAQGRPVREVVVKSYSWTLPFRDREFMRDDR